MDTRFDRHNLVPGWQQNRLSQATVILIGVGAVGNEVARILALSGLGSLILCDFDTVSISNLSRCSLFREEDIGRLKVEAAADSLQTLAPDLQLDIRPYQFVRGVGLAELRDAALVVCCLDSRSSRIRLAGRCSLVRAPYIDGGTHPWGGEVRPYLDPDGACYACQFTPEQRSQIDSPWSCADLASDPQVGAIAATSALVGSWMALIATRFLMELKYPPGSINIDGVRGISRLVEERKDPNCLLHGPIEISQKVKVSIEDTVETLLQQVGKSRKIVSWEPIQHSMFCRSCSFSEERWGIPKLENCPHCSNPLIPETTLNISSAPSNLLLKDLGIAPREILAIRDGHEVSYVELK